MGQRPVVFLMHGFADSADAWIVHKEKSPVALLANEGFDVWVGNARGNKYNEVPEDDFFFWDFTVTTLGEYDTPAMIDYVLETTG